MSNSCLRLSGAERAGATTWGPLFALVPIPANRTTLIATAFASSVSQFVRARDPWAKLVYHTICLTQIHFFRLIGSYFVFERSRRRGRLFLRIPARMLPSTAASPANKAQS